MSDNQKTILVHGAKLLASDHPGWTIERLLCHPKHAIAFCRRVREKLGVSTLPDESILSTLLNQRKRGNLKLSEI